MARRKVSKIERFGQIWDYMLAVGRGEATATEIAKFCGMANSPYFRSVLADLVADGWLLYRDEPYRENITRRLYRPNIERYNAHLQSTKKTKKRGNDESE